MGHGRQPCAGLDQPSDGSNRLKMGDDFGYFNEVKEEFKDAPEKYGQFLAIMEDLEARRLDRADGVARLRYLFKGHRSLLLGLNALLPKGYEIVIPAVENPEERQLKGDEALINKAVKFVNKVKTRFQASTEYKAFLRILKEHRKGTKPLAEVYREVEELFNNQPDLVAEFKGFLPSVTPFPNPIAIPAVQNPEGKGVNFDEAINFVNKVKTRFQASTEYKAFLRILKEHRKETKPLAEVYREVEELFNNQPDLVAEFKGFLPSVTPFPNPIAIPAVQNPEGKGVNFDEAINFVNKVKIRFQASTEYKTFLCIVGEYGKGTKSVAEVYREVNELLYDQRDLMEEFNEFLPSDQKLGNKVEKERIEKED